MKIEKFKYPQSSFLSVQKDSDLIIDMMLKNERLVNLLYYTDKDPLDYERHPKLSHDDSYQLLGNQIKIVPKVYVDEQVLQYVIITFDNFVPNGSNPEFRDNTIQFDIICHFNQWQLKDFQIRPYKIAAEIDSMFNGARLSGIGTLNFLGATQTAISGKEYAGITLLYETVHGEDDKKYIDEIYLNRPENAELRKRWEEILNSKLSTGDTDARLGDDRFARPSADNDLETNLLETLAKKD